jgi:hypothetical protein
MPDQLQGSRRIASISSSAGATRPVLGYRDSGAATRRAPHALPLCTRAVAPVGLLLSVRAPECLGAAPRRSPQPRAARCRSQGGSPSAATSSARLGSCRCMPRPARCSPNTSAVATVIWGQRRVSSYVLLQLGASGGVSRKSSSGCSFPRFTLDYAGPARAAIDVYDTGRSARGVPALAPAGNHPANPGVRL